MSTDEKIELTALSLEQAMKLVEDDKGNMVIAIQVSMGNMTDIKPIMVTTLMKKGMGNDAVTLVWNSLLMSLAQQMGFGTIATEYPLTGEPPEGSTIMTSEELVSIGVPLNVAEAINGSSEEGFDATNVTSLNEYRH